jgi:tetratricopeptide (TPR) repeat protein
MSALFRSFAFVLAALALAPFVRAQTPSGIDAPTTAPAPAPDANRTPGPDLTSPVEAARVKIAEAVKRMNATPPDVEGSLADLTQAIQLKPDSAFAYLLRGSLYTQKKMFTEAEADFSAADRINPGNIVIRFNLSELKFMQKQYDEARTGFFPLQKDPDMGDFAIYKVFLCDLFGGHEDVAKSELDAIDKKGDDASYYFSHAAWDLYHKNIEDARGWLVSASHIYEPKKFTSYGESLRYLGYLPLPKPKDDASSQ